jgi:6-phosphogluconate dehydrogenase
VNPILQAIAAKVEGGSSCCDWVGENGAGHFVKMVHNGIEYGDMQLICETYDIMKHIMGLSYEKMGDVFDEWNKGELNSYLIEITRDILRYKDEDESPLVEKILDTAGQKGTGKWTGIAALELGVPLTLIGEAVFGRCLSAAKDERVKASRNFSGPGSAFADDTHYVKDVFVKDLGKALYAAKVVSYAQGYLLMREAAKEYKWNLNNGGIALMWRGGCIIRSAFLGKIKEAFDKNPELENLLLDPFFTAVIEDAQKSWRTVLANAVFHGIPTLAFSSALAYFDGYRSERLPANLLQAQRDYFGAHTYERLDKKRGEFFHTNWTGHGGTTSASTYTV